MNQGSGQTPPFQVSYSERCRDEARQLLARAASVGQLPLVAKAIEDIDRRLQWIPLDFGEPLRDYTELGLQERIGTVSPLVVKFGVDEERRMVYVPIPFKLLPNSGI